MDTSSYVAAQNVKKGIQDTLASFGIHNPVPSINPKTPGELGLEINDNIGEIEMNPTNTTQTTELKNVQFKPVAWIGLSRGGKAATLKFDGDKELFTIPLGGLQDVISGKKKGVRVSTVIRA